MTLPGIEFGACYNGWGDPDVGDFAAFIEDLGFDSVWTGEHISNWQPELTLIPLLGAFAARTRRVTVGSAALLLPLRNPAIIAKELATLDIISHGRLVVGIGIGGENPAEFAACGIPVRERVGRTHELLQILPRLWSEESVSFSGKYYQLDGVSLNPLPPRTGGPPIYVAGRKEPAWRRAALYGKGFLPQFYTPERCAESMAQIQAFASETGRDLTGFDHTVSLFTCVSNNRDEAKRTAEAYLSAAFRSDFSALVDRYCVLGTPAQCIERIREYIDVGVGHVLFVLPQEPSMVWREQFSLIANEILPAFADLRHST